MRARETIPGSEAQSIAAAIRIAARDEQLLERGEPADGWQMSRVPPNRVVAAAPGVTLSDGWRIDAYQWYRDGNGTGAVCAVPRDVLDASPVLQDQGQFGPPACAASSISVALIPDGSAESFLARSLLVRELGEIGAIWHGVRWGAHDLLTGALSPDEEALWSWESPPPKGFDPVVEIEPPAFVRVTFHTHSGLGGERILAHVDEHVVRDGSITSSQTVLASREGGWVP